MKALLKIGYTTYLLRDVAVATKVLNLLSGAVEVEDRTYQNRIVLRDVDVSMELKIAPENAVLVRKRPDGVEEPVTEISPRKKLRGATRLALPGA